MKNSYSTLIRSIFMLLLSACGPSISGTDEQSFKTSKAKMEEKLNKTEKEDLEKALRVFMLKGMKEKWNTPEKYGDKSFNKIVMEMVDGKTYSAIVSYAEDFLNTFKSKEELVEIVNKVIKK